MSNRTPIDRDACTGELKAQLRAHNRIETSPDDGLGYLHTTIVHVEVYCDGDLLCHPHGFELPTNDDPAVEAHAFLERVKAEGTIDREQWDVLRWAGDLMATYA